MRVAQITSNKQHDGDGKVGGGAREAGSGAKRSAAMPGLAHDDRVGMPGSKRVMVIAVVAPEGTPKAIVTGHSKTIRAPQYAGNAQRLAGRWRRPSSVDRWRNRRGFVHARSPNGRSVRNPASGRLR